jgi:gluconate 2-dehydrogenase gamma chain
MEGEDPMTAKQKNLRRREFLAMGVAATVVAGTAASCSHHGGSSWRFFTAEQARTVEAICEQIIPADQHPGAAQAGVVQYIDLQLTRHFKQHQRTYVQGIAAVDAASQSRFGKRFADVIFNQQAELLGDLAKNAKIFFDLILAHTMQGFYGDPRHGGNREMVSWRMLGLPCPPVRGRMRFGT